MPKMNDPNISPIIAAMLRPVPIPAYFANNPEAGDATFDREDCKYFYYDEDMGKSIPMCRYQCDFGDGKGCKGCLRYVAKKPIWTPTEDTDERP